MYAADGRQSVWPEGPAAPRRRGQRRNLRSGLTPKGAGHWPDGAGMVRELCYLPDDDLALICSTA